jgi:hypothetical protein
MMNESRGARKEVDNISLNHFLSDHFLLEIDAFLIRGQSEVNFIGS